MKTGTILKKKKWAYTLVVKHTVVCYGVQATRGLACPRVVSTLKAVVDTTEGSVKKNCWKTSQ